MSEINKNLSNWDKLRTPPFWAMKQISGGRLSGKTDINPQWRYKAMTEVYGPVGTGWKFSIIDTKIVNGSDGQMMVFVTVTVQVFENNVWSEPVYAIGGDFLVIKEKNGLYNNDEAFKMATTDALGNCLKYFGVGADIYEGQFNSKYSAKPEPKELVDDFFETPKKKTTHIAFITEDQRKEIGALFAKVPADLVEKIYLHYKVDSTAFFPASAYDALKKRLNEEINKNVQ